MPKEVIYGDCPPYTVESSARSVIGVHWDSGGTDYLQVSASLFNDDGKYVDGYGNVHQSEGQDALRREVWAQGFYVGLDRKGVNALIRHLRRARDQAFGRDE